MIEPQSFNKTYLRKHFALPMEHGSWIWLIGPLLVGIAAGGRLSLDLVPLIVAALFLFLIRQPINIFVKALSGRRARSDWKPALFWSAIYSIIIAVATYLLIQRGHTLLLWLALPGLPVFGWHLWLVAKREDRRQMLLEMIGSGVLALAAPAAYWVTGGEENTIALLVWVLTWVQSAASISHVYLCLEQRELKEPPSRSKSWRSGFGMLLFHLSIFVGSIVIALMQIVPWPIPLAFGLMLLNATESVLNPAVGIKPSRIGFRQLGASSLFVLLLILSFTLFTP